MRPRPHVSPSCLCLRFALACRARRAVTLSRVLTGAGPAQKVQEHQVREVLKCILHTIIFNRALGHVSPRDMDLQLVNVSYVEVDDESVDRQVNAGLQAVQDFVRVFKGRAAAPAVRAVLGPRPL